MPPRDPVARRDWFANNAPPMPEWFKAKVFYPTYSGPPRTSEIYPIELLVVAMRAEGRKEPMPAGAERYPEQRLLHDQAWKMYQALCAEAEFVQWRAYYGRLMVNHL